MKIRVRITPDQYKAIGRALLEKQQADVSVTAFLKDVFDLASKKAVRLLEEGCALSEIQETFAGTEEKHE